MGLAKTMLVEQQAKIDIRQIYDAVAADYDHPTNGVFSQAMAEAILSQIVIQPGDKVLDVGTGTGAFALQAAHTEPASQVIGVDLSTAMLAQARRKAEQVGLSNIQWQAMDMEALDFPDDYFDRIISCSSLYFLPDMASGLRNIVQKLKPGGQLVASFYQCQAFTPLSTLFKQHYAHFQAESETTDEPWERLSDVNYLTTLYRQVGISKTVCYPKTFGFELDRADRWWDILWNTGYRHTLLALSEADRIKFRRQHLTDVATLCVDKPYWVDTSLMVFVGYKV